MFRPRTITQDSQDQLKAVGNEHAPSGLASLGMLTEAAVLMALTMAIRRCTRAVKVTHSMMISGNSILLLQAGDLQEDAGVARTRALSSWLAERTEARCLRSRS